MFLHILADTLGSVGVIVSAVLMQAFGWMIADPICSMFIAILIALSVLALIKDSVLILMQRQPVALDHVLPQCYQKVRPMQYMLSHIIILIKAITCLTSSCICQIFVNIIIHGCMVF